jgi:hypothetical protein
VGGPERALSETHEYAYRAFTFLLVAAVSSKHHPFVLGLLAIAIVAHGKTGRVVPTERGRPLRRASSPRDLASSQVRSA